MHPCTVQPHASLFLFSSCSSGRARATTEDHRHLLVAVQYASVQAAGGAPLNHSTDEAKPLCTSYVFLSIVIPAATGRGAPVEKQKDSVQYERAPGYPRTTTYLSRVSWGGRNREDGGSVAQCGRLREQARTTTRRSRAPEDCAPEQRRSLRLRYLYLAMTACGPWLLTDHGCLPWPWPHADGDGPPCASRTRYPVASKTLLPRVCGAAGHTRFRSRDPRCPALGGWARRPLATVDQRPCTWTGGGSGFKPRRVWVGGGARSATRGGKSQRVLHPIANSLRPCWHQGSSVAKTLRVHHPTVGFGDRGLLSTPATLRAPVPPSSALFGIVATPLGPPLPPPAILLPCSR